MTTIRKGTSIESEASVDPSDLPAGTMFLSATLATAIAAVMKAGSYLVIKRIGDSGENYVGAWD